MYPWGDNFNEATTNILFGYFEPIDSFHSGTSVYGVYNMFGNAGEWVNDWYSDNYYSDSPQQNPKGPESGSYRVFRNSKYFRPSTTKIYTRDIGYPEGYGTNSDGSIWYFYPGFRCAKDATP